MKFNKYNLVARFYPAILCSLPILVLNFFLLDSYTGEFFSAIEGYKWIGGITFSAILIYLLAQIGRFVGKEVFEKIHFSDELSMPTTQLLLHSDKTYSSEQKLNIHSKIANDFSMTVCTLEQESLDEIGARRIIVDCVSLIRGKVKDGRLILQHNIEYGFARNLIGGSAVAVFLSIFNLIVFGYFLEQFIPFYISLFLAITYLLVVIIGRRVIQRYGLRYAKILIQEYLLS